MRTKRFLLTVLAVMLAIPLFAKDTTDYFALATNGSSGEISTALKKNANLKVQVFGDNRETFLMLVLKADRSLEIVNILLKADCSPTDKAKDKRTPLMFAAQYSSDPAVIDAIVSYGTVFGVGRSGRVTAKDSSGHNSFYYAKQNPNPAIYEALTAYAKDPDAKTASTQKTTQTETAQSQTEKTSTSSGEKKSGTSVGGTATTTYVPSFGGEDESVSSVSISDEENSREEESPEVTEEEADTDSMPQPELESEPEDSSSEEPSTEEPEEAAPEENVEPEPAPVLPEEEVLVSVTTEAEPEAREEEQSTAEEAEPEEEDSTKEEEVNEPEPVPEVKAEPKEPSPYLYDYAVTAQPAQPEESVKTQTVKIDSPNQADENGVTLLMKAAKAGNDWDVQNLIANGADVNTRDQDGWSALMYAVRYQNSLSIVETLIKAGAHIRIRNKYNATPLLIAADYSQNPGILSLLLEGRSASEEEVFKAFVMTITSTAGSDHIKQTKIQIFLDMGISVNRVWKGRTPLMYAAEYCDSTAVLKMLLDEGARTQARDADGNTAFDYAKQNRRLPHDDVYWTLNEGVGY